MAEACGFEIGHGGPIDRIPDTDTWEGRMAIDTALRTLPARMAESERAEAEWRASRARLERQAWVRVAGMTLGEAADLLRWERENGPIGCACIGPPLCCRYGYDQARALVRAAHIAVKLISERPEVA